MAVRKSIKDAGKESNEIAMERAIFALPNGRRYSNPGERPKTKEEDPYQKYIEILQY